jgi:hypothetical protein
MTALEKCGWFGVCQRKYSIFGYEDGSLKDTCLKATSLLNQLLLFVGIIFFFAFSVRMAAIRFFRGHYSRYESRFQYRVCVGFFLNKTTTLDSFSTFPAQHAPFGFFSPLFCETPKK